MKIGLAFPEISKQNREHFLNIIENQDKKLDLIIFPEGFESVHPENGVKPEEIENEEAVKNLMNKYYEICNKFNINIIVGIQIHYKKASSSGEENDQYCLFVKPTGEKQLYHKHSTSKFTAFFDDNWSIKNNFPVIQVDNTNIGISICHDSYISLIPKVLKKKGADIWVNISYENVRPNIWQSVLQTRATENKMIALCTLHRNSKESNPQGEPYAFSEVGKIKLKDLESDSDILYIPFEERTGKIFYFDTLKYETHPTDHIKELELAKEAQKITISSDDEGNLKIEGEETYPIEKISVKDFIFSPEKLWALSLERKNETTLFVVTVDDEEEWKRYQPKIERIIKGRVIEFSTLFIFVARKNNILMAAYRSSNYKASRIFYPKKFPLELDERYLKGLYDSTCKISLKDFRKKGEHTYIERVNQIIDFLKL